MDACSITTRNEIIANLEDQSKKLLIASRIDLSRDIEVRDTVIQQLLQRTSDLVRGAAALGVNQNPACLGIVARCLLEDLINALWAIVSCENAHQYLNAGNDTLMRIARINFDNGRLKILDRLTKRDITEEYLKENPIENPSRAKNIIDKAIEANVPDLYQIFYRFLSMETHGHTHKNTDITIDEQVLTHLECIGTLSKTIGFSCVFWLQHQKQPDNESLRATLGF